MDTPPLNLTGISPEIDRYRPNLTDTARCRAVLTAFGVLGRVIIF